MKIPKNGGECCEYRHKANEGHSGFVCECVCHSKPQPDKGEESWEVAFDKQFVRDDGLMDKYQQVEDDDIGFGTQPMAEHIKAFISQEIKRAREDEFSRTVLVLSGMMVNSKTMPELDVIEQCFRAIGQDYKARTPQVGEK